MLLNVGAASNNPDVMTILAPLLKVTKLAPVKVLVPVMFIVKVPFTVVAAVKALLLSNPLMVRLAYVNGDILYVDALVPLLYSTVLFAPNVRLSVPAKPIAPPLEPFVDGTIRPFALAT